MPRGTVTKPVTVTAPPPAQLAGDAFGRNLATGWGSADLGGAWTLSSAAANFSVIGGVGKQRMAALGANTISYLGGVSSTDTELRTSISLDQAPTGGGIYVSAIGRRSTRPTTTARGCASGRTAR